MSDVSLSLHDFSVAVTPDQTLSLNDLKGHYTVLYFYPKDNTPGCSQEGQDFSEHYADFKALNCHIYGISKDSLKQHQNFKAKYAFPFELIADTDETLCQMFDVIKLKKNFGKEYLGIERSTFLLDPVLNLVKAWRKVKVTGHAQDVLNTLKQQA